MGARTDVPKFTLNIMLANDRMDRYITNALGAQVHTYAMKHDGEVSVDVEAPTLDDAKKKLSVALELIVKLYGSEGEER